MPSKALHIDAAAREIREVEYEDYTDLQRMVGGSVDIGFSWRNGDVLFVDDEGLFKPQEHFFRVLGNAQPLPGNGVVVGPDVNDEIGCGTKDPTITADQLRSEITFLSRDQVDAWAKANASEPAVSVSVTREDGTEEMEVLERFGSLYADIPRVEKRG